MSFRENHWRGLADHHTAAFSNVVTHADKADDLHHELGHHPQEANAPGLLSRARQLLRAFADAGQQSVTGLRLVVGPNGILAWPEASQVDGSEPYVISVLAVPERSAAPVDRQSTVTTPLVEPTGSSVDTSLKAPAYS